MHVRVFLQEQIHKLSIKIILSPFDYKRNCTRFEAARFLFRNRCIYCARPKGLAQQIKIRFCAYRETLNNPTKRKHINDCVRALYNKINVTERCVFKLGFGIYSLKETSAFIVGFNSTDLYILRFQKKQKVCDIFFTSCNISGPV